MATIQLVDVTKTFATPPATSTRRRETMSGDDATVPAGGPVHALDHINLTIPQGQTMVIVGPSGCGKSTLLRIVAGLEREYTGQIRYDERPMEAVPPGERKIGMVFQNYALYPHFEGHGNLSFFFRLRKATDAETEERIRITSEIMGFGFRQLLARKPGTLSGGQQQRLAIGRAIVRNPELFLFDEPLSNLDAKLRMQTRVEIKRLLQRFGITALYVTHDQVEAMALSDQVAVMRAGRVEQVGRFQAIVQQPANRFVAGFLGSPPMNLFDGVLLQDGQLTFGMVPVPLPSIYHAAAVAGQDVTVGIRPEAVRVVADGAPAADTLYLQGTADVVEPDFGRQIQWVHIRSEVGDFVATAPVDEPIFAGHLVKAALDLHQLHLFDSQSGDRLGSP
ncbi:MAG TPA: ABC transporter ATP-binding protein [Caldilineaceae bacterium]|nr:ABC transporter ATP-binding protein [Caldilineaceae bacterium]